MGTLIDVTAPTEQSEGTRLQVLRWLKQVGEQVAAQEPLLELETDKVTLELPAPAAGVLRQILKTERQEVALGEPLGRIEMLTAEITQAPRSEAAQPSGALPSAARPLIEPNRSLPAKGGAERLSPSVRRLLREHALDATVIRGSGAQGRITAQDVLAHVVAAGPAPSDSAPSSTAASAHDGPELPPSRRLPHSLMRKRIAERMVESLLRTAPHVTTVFEADLTAVVNHRARHRSEFDRAGAPRHIQGDAARQPAPAARLRRRP